ncbi:hypothetical protein [Paenibacillus sp. NEAU-GSW1]|nr:hypothetical protein [Paenibacillus sp. NEAU-GSW1]
MSSAKRKPPALKTKPKEEVNKKAIVWIGAAIGVVVIAVAVLLIVSN